MSVPQDEHFSGLRSVPVAHLGQREYPILEFDPSAEALLEPNRLIKPADVPERCVLCFFREMIDQLVSDGRGEEIAALHSEMGRHPIYEIQVNGQRVAVAHPGLGGPLAAGTLEEIIALGCRKFVVCGSAGVLHRELAVGHLIVPIAAVRDEGTSYHYLPPSRQVDADAHGIQAVERVLRRQNIPYLLAKTWTTDAFYRETRAKIVARRAEGCVTVEMEAAAFFAVARFRGVPLAQILYGGDDCSGDLWDSRHYHTREEIRRRLFELACEASLEL